MKMVDPKTEKEILDAIRRQLPEMVAYHVKRSGLLGFSLMRNQA